MNSDLQMIKSAKNSVLTAFYCSKRGSLMGVTLRNKRILICKTNQIGDVTFALPIAAAIKQSEPTAKIVFLGRAYTQSLIELCEDVDVFADYDALCECTEKEAANQLKKFNIDIALMVFPVKKIARMVKYAKIPMRVGLIGRWYHWQYANRFVHISRKSSPLHESQLDLMYLKVLGLPYQYSLAEIASRFHYKQFSLNAHMSALLKKDKFNLILHPKTRGEHIEWPPEHFYTLVSLLDAKKFNVLFTGTEKEGEIIRSAINLKAFSHVSDLFGQLTLDEFMGLIQHSDGLVAASTGPVHLAANFRVNTLGLYAPIKPFHAGRWGPIGKRASVLSLDKNCERCRYSAPCYCIAAIKPQEVFEIMMKWYHQTS